MATEFDFVTAAHFRAAPDRTAARRLFKDSVTAVEIEIFSYCNRRCWFCPNAKIDRISENVLMAPELYSGILAQLAEITYDGMISYSRYNEPLADRIILPRLREAREAVPAALLHTNTNGDYLTADYLDALYAEGLRSLNIQVYLQNEARYDHEAMRRKAAMIASKLRIEPVLTDDRPDSWLEYALPYKDMTIRLRARNFEINGCNRGDTLDIRSEEIRTNPCLSPFRYFFIDYNGKTVPCCNLRSDVQEHADCVTYDLSAHNDIFAAYAQSPLVGWRRSLVGWQEKSGVCKHCTFPSHLPAPTAEDLATHDRLTALAQNRTH